MSHFLHRTVTKTVPIHLIRGMEHTDLLETLPAAARQWVLSHGFKGDSGKHALIPNAQGEIEAVWCGVGARPVDLWSIAGLPDQLPAGQYTLAGIQDPELLTKLAMGWELARYRFDRYKKNEKTFPVLQLPESVDRPAVSRMVSAICFARDLINTPAEDMGPGALAEAAQTLATQYQARCTITRGDALLREGYPMIHAVGRASDEPPCLIDIRWGEESAPKVTLVGKGVCFDSGGLDIKDAGNMRLMKKDMGGAAVVLGLARAIMDANLPVRLRVLVPAVENSISGNALRPGDIIPTRKGISVEIGNTDAEGRLILCDALWEASQESPDLLVDCATLTGAARTALGTDIPAVFSGSTSLAQKLIYHGQDWQDPLWQLPLWEGYREQLDSPIADLCNISDSSYAGAIMAALYLREFVTQPDRWLHLDMMAWNLKPRPGRPAGGEAMALRALYAMIADRVAATR
jgi:leucyl aminopeptidase